MRCTATSAHQFYLGYLHRYTYNIDEQPETFKRKAAAAAAKIPAEKTAGKKRPGCPFRVISVTDATVEPRRVCVPLRYVKRFLKFNS